MTTAVPSERDRSMSSAMDTRSATAENSSSTRNRQLVISARSTRWL